MFGHGSKTCESNCQCSGLITDSFKINSGNNSTRHRREESTSRNFKHKMRPQSLNFTVSPLKSPAAVNRRILGEIQNSPIQTSSPLKVNTSKPYERPTSNCYNLSSFSDRAMFRKGSKLSRVFEDRSNFRRASEEKENLPMSETMVNLEVDEETRDVVDNVECTMTRNALTSWCMAKLDVSDPTPLSRSLCDDEMAQAVPGEAELDDADMEALHDLEEELQPDNFNVCNNYEIVSTDSPDIISRGRSTTSKISGKNLQFGAPLLEHETSTSFNRSSLTGRTLNFDDSFEFTPPAHKTATPAKQCTVKKSLKFTDSPIIVRENSESSIGTMSSPSSTIKSCLSESSNSHESGFMSEMEEQYFEAEDSTSPPRVRNFKELISGPIRDRRISFNRSHSLQQPGKSDLFAIEEDVRRSQKRPDEELVVGPSKRRKSSCSSPQSFKKPTEPSRPVLHRAYSENNASIMSALARSAVEPDLIGDFSLPCALPLTGGAHADLRSISCHTLAALLRGDYRGLVQRYTVIDCRYPYEYEGGHIAGAVNLYTPAQILDLVERLPAPAAPTTPAAPDAPPRSVLVFHCEFSRERGPKLSRFLRSSDRAKNKENYPYLHYPEIYLLHEGYKKFYSIYPGLCTPEGYTAMLDSRHRDDFKLHRSNSLSSTTKPPRTQKKERRSRLML